MSEDDCCSGREEFLLHLERLRKQLEHVLFNDKEVLEALARGDTEIYLTDGTYKDSVILVDSVSFGQ